MLRQSRRRLLIAASAHRATMGRTGDHAAIDRIQNREWGDLVRARQAHRRGRFDLAVRAKARAKRIERLCGLLDCGPASLHPRLGRDPCLAMSDLRSPTLPIRLRAARLAGPIMWRGSWNSMATPS